MPFRLPRPLPRHRPLLVELFVIANVAFLILDVFIAHSVNAFADWGEWIPMVFAVGATLVLTAALVREKGRYDEGAARITGLVVGWLAIAVGVGGLVLHLASHFFQELTLQNLVYSAPFVAPLSFAGLGFLLLLDRIVPTDTLAWGKWVLFLAWGGMLGNFLLSLVDHAQNGFFYVTEWIPVVVSAAGVGYLFAVIVRPANRFFLDLGLWVLGLQVLTGFLGFFFHVSPVFGEAGAPFGDRVIFGAPVFAPLLFADIALLAAIGLWDVRVKLVTEEWAEVEA